MQGSGHLPALNGAARPLQGLVRSVGRKAPVLAAPLGGPGGQWAAQFWLVRQLHESIRPDLVIHTSLTSRVDYWHMLYLGLHLKTVQKLQLIQNVYCNYWGGGSN